MAVFWQHRSEAELLANGPFTLGSWDSFRQTWVNLTTFNDFQMVDWAVNSAISWQAGFCCRW